MSHLMTALAMRHEGLRPSEKIILYWLADHHNSETGLCCPSISTLSKRAEMSNAAVSRNLSKLEEMGLIKREKRVRENGSQTSTSYELLIKQPIAKRDGAYRKMRGGPIAKCDPHNLGRLNLGNEHNKSADADLLLRDAKKSKSEKPEKSRIPENWVPDDADFKYASDKNLTETEIEEMRDEFQAYWADRTDAAGKKSKRGWSQCWKSHVRRNANQYIRSRSVAGKAYSGGHGQGGSIASAVARRHAQRQI